MSEYKQWKIPNSKPWITEDDRESVDTTLALIASTRQPCGSIVAEFEQELAEYLGRKYVVCVSSGTMALELAFTAARYVGRMLGAFGFIATANALERRDLLTTFIDHPTEAILGEPWEPWSEVSGAEEPVRDACQAFGAKLPPSLADCYSFNWNKPITCLGGGCVATDDAGLAGSVDMLANHGRMDGPWAEHAYVGTNARMSDMQAALGRSQLRRVGEILERRRQVAKWYWMRLNLHAALTVKNYPDTRDSWFLFPIELSNRDEVHAKMLERGIQTRSCADWLLPAHPYYAEKYGYKRGDFPEAERRADRTLLLPLYPEMSFEQVQEVCRALEECDAQP